MNSIDVIVADDHKLVRDGLVALLKAEPRFRVIAALSDGQEALERITALRPHVAVVDIRMPHLTGIEIVRKVQDAGLRTAVVLLSMHQEAAFVRAGIQAGASGYVLKEAASHELIEAVRAAAAGEMYLSPKVAKVALRPPAAPEGGVEVLSSRERDVLRLLADGLSSKEIAARLDVGLRTVDSHRRSIMDKLGIHNVPGLVKFAIRNHLATLETTEESQ